MPCYAMLGDDEWGSFSAKQPDAPCALPAAPPVPLEAELIADRLCYWSTLTAWDAAAGKRLPRPACEMRASPQFRALHVLGHGTPEEDIEARRCPQLAPTAAYTH